jgi:hypothetical protein
MYEPGKGQEPKPSKGIDFMYHREYEYDACVAVARTCCCRSALPSEAGPARCHKHPACLMEGRGSI